MALVPMTKARFVQRMLLDQMKRELHQAKEDAAAGAVKGYVRERRTKAMQMLKRDRMRRRRHA